VLDRSCRVHDGRQPAYLPGWEEGRIAEQQRRFRTVLILGAGDAADADPRLSAKRDWRGWLAGRRCTAAGPEIQVCPCGRIDDVKRV
jgi:hypothetical protein